MAPDGRDGPQGIPLGGIAVLALVAAGFVAQQFSPESPRPRPTLSKMERFSDDTQDIDARLWQDPLEVVAQYRDHERSLNLQLDQLKRRRGHFPSTSSAQPRGSANSNPASSASTNAVAAARNPLPQSDGSRASGRKGSRKSGQVETQKPVLPPDDFRTSKRLQDSIAKWVCGDGAHEVRLLPVMVPGGPFVEESEMRRRTRYAVLSALMTQEYDPANEDAIDYAHFPEKAGKNRDPDKLLPEFVPFEWFHKRVVDGERVSAVVLWLDEDAFRRQPLQRLRHLVELLTPSGCAKHPNMELLSARVLGPASSTVAIPLAESIKSEIENDGPKSTAPNADGKVQVISERRVPPLTILSASATAFLDLPHGTRLDDRETSQFRLCTETETVCLLRVTGPNSDLVTALLEELASRRIAPGTPIPGNPFQRQLNALVVISERDTTYSREFASKLHAEVELDPTARANIKSVVHHFSYLRGIDGHAPTKVSSILPSQAPFDSKREGTPDPARLRSHGNHQADYLERLVRELEELRENGKDPQRKAIEISAIVIVGNDVYDKLLILRALKPAFPKAVYLTTDLDARLLDAGEAKWARNLIVASSYGLSLHPDLQLRAPPFRDSYQTANYFAARLLSWDSNCAHDVVKDHQAWLGAPLLYEVGRSKQIPLKDSSARPVSICGGNLMHVQPDSRMPKPPGLGAVLATILIVAAFGIALVVLRMPWRGKTPFGIGNLSFLAAVRAAGIVAGAAVSFMSTRWLLDSYDKGGMPLALVMISCVFFWLNAEIRKHQPGKRNSAHAIGAGALGLGLALGGIIAGAAQIWRQQEEPFAWLQGVSVWPTQMLRLALCIVAIWFFLRMYQVLRTNSEEIERDYGFTYQDEPAVPLRDRLKSVWSKFARFVLIRLGMSKDTPGATPPLSAPEERLAAYDEREAQLIWQTYRQTSRTRWRGVRVMLVSLLFLLIGGLCTVSLDDVPNLPIRGQQNFAYVQFVLMYAVLLSVTLLIAVLDVTLLTVRELIVPLRGQNVLFSDQVIHRFRMLRRVSNGVSTRFISRFLVLQMIARRTEVVTRLIYYPFIAFAILVVARSSLIDNWQTPAALIVIFSMSFATVAVCVVILHSAARSMKDGIVRGMQDQLTHARAARNAEPEALAQMERLFDQARNESRGAFSSLATQPAVKSLLYPVGGLSGLEVLDHIVLPKF